MTLAAGNTPCGTLQKTGPGTSRASLLISLLLATLRSGVICNYFAISVRGLNCSAWFEVGVELAGIVNAAQMVCRVALTLNLHWAVSSEHSCWQLSCIACLLGFK
eukprot:357579-Amphidinium_carterae.1